MSDIRKAIMARLGEFARPGAKAEMANHIRTVAEDKEASRRGLRRMIDQLESEWQSLNNQPSKAGRIPRMETIKKQIAGLEERFKSLSSRPGAKARMQNAAWMQHVSNMLRDLTTERQRVQVWISGPTTVKVAGMWMSYNRYGKGAAIASRMAYYLTQAAGTPGKYSGQDIKDSPRKGTNTTIWTVSNVPEEAVAYLKAWGIGTSPKAFAGFTGESAVAYDRPGAKAKMARDLKVRKGNFTDAVAIVGQNGGGSASFYAGLILRHKDGEEQVLWMKHGYSTEKAAERAALQRFDAHVSRMSRPGAKARMAKRYDAKIVGNELVRSDGRRYRITGRKPSLPNAREMLGEVEWLMMVGENGAEYSVQRFNDGGYRVFGGGSGMRVQWDGLVRASRPGAKAKMGFVGTAGQAGAIAARGMRDGAAAYRDGKPAVLNRLDPKYHGWSDKDLEVYGNFWMRGWTGEQMKEMRTRDPKQGIDLPGFRASRPGAKSTNALSNACWQGYEAVGTKKQDGKTVPNCVPKATAAKPESQDIESEEVKAGLKLMEKADEKVSEKIRTLIKEGKPQDQAVAIALDMKRRGEL